MDPDDLLETFDVRCRMWCYICCVVGVYIYIKFLLCDFVLCMQRMQKKNGCISVIYRSDFMSHLVPQIQPAIQSVYDVYAKDAKTKKGGTSAFYGPV